MLAVLAAPSLCADFGRKGPKLPALPDPLVGLGAPDAVAEYARDFGPAALLDPGGKVPLAGGVPQFIVTSSDGRILKPPVPEEDVRGLASHLGLM